MYRTLTYISILALLLFMALFYTENYQPQLAADILVQVDVLGISDVARSEQDRLANIKKLTIPYEQKEALANRTVFMDASTSMVDLALGEPRQTKLIDNTTYYIYYLPNDKRPTIFVFESDKLVDACKGSALDIVDISTGTAAQPPPGCNRSHPNPAGPAPAAP